MISKPNAMVIGSKNLSDKRPAPTQSRLDQPGLSVFPHQITRDDSDGMKYPMCFPKKDGGDLKFTETQYYKDLEKFFNDYYFTDGKFRPDLSNEEGQKRTIDSEDMNTYLKSGDKFSKDAWKKPVEDYWKEGKVVVFVSLNKVLHWELKPRANLNGLTPAFQEKFETNEFEKDSLYFNCFSWDRKEAKIVEKTNSTKINYTVSFAGKGYIKKSDLDWQNTTQVNGSVVATQEILNGYIKPFVPFVISADDDTASAKAFTADDVNVFRCYPVAANLNYPGENDEMAQQLNQNGLGFIEFGFDRQPDDVCN